MGSGRGSYGAATAPPFYSLPFQAQDEAEKSPTDPPSQEPSAPPPPPEQRYRVYRDLWGRGLYLTHGGKFGGDFLVYPGPPALFHAAALALCPAPGSGLAPGALVAAARLGTHVRKTLLLCSAGPPGGAPAYTSLQWRADLA
ncbi:tRNA-splicing endonuclease subunit Sen34 [Guaruba guarouba]